MCAYVNEELGLVIPSWVADLASFRRWADSDDFPEQGRVCFLDGECWIDMSREQLDSHNKVKTRFYIALGSLVDAEKLGDFFSDGVSVTHPEAALSAIPDALFLSKETIERGRVRLIEGARRGFAEVEGSPDMVLEVVSDSSVRKDTVRLKKLYWKAGVVEYWLVDARKTPIRFDVLRHGAKGYVAARKRDGWARSDVFARSFRLTRESDDQGNPAFRLDVR